MKWAIVAACLSCGDPTPFPVVTVTDVDRDTCAVLAELTRLDTLANVPRGVILAAWCEAIDDWQDGVDAYPQRR